MPVWVLWEVECMEESPPCQLWENITKVTTGGKDSACGKCFNWDRQWVAVMSRHIDICMQEETNFWWLQNLNTFFTFINFCNFCLAKCQRGGSKFEICWEPFTLCDNQIHIKYVDIWRALNHSGYLIKHWVYWHTYMKFAWLFQHVHRI